MFEEEARPPHELEYDEPEQTAPEEPAARERRRPPVPDWGGDDLFNQVPRRRFTRPGPSAHARRPSASPITTHQLRRNSDAAPSASLRSTEGRSGAGFEHETADGAGSVAGLPLVTVFESDAGPRPGAAGARAARDRRRPRRTVDERLGARPDRVAAWAFILGLILILLAVGTADAAALPFP